jgi:hypothetical protein
MIEIEQLQSILLIWFENFKQKVKEDIHHQVLDHLEMISQGIPRSSAQGVEINEEWLEQEAQAIKRQQEQKASSNTVTVEGDTSQATRNIEIKIQQLELHNEQQDLRYQQLTEQLHLALEHIAHLSEKVLNLEGEVEYLKSQLNIVSKE